MALRSLGVRPRRAKRALVSRILKPQSTSNAPVPHATTVALPRLPLPREANCIAYQSRLSTDGGLRVSAIQLGPDAPQSSVPVPYLAPLWPHRDRAIALPPYRQKN